MGQAKQRRLKEAAVGWAVLETAQRVAHVVAVGAEALTGRKGGAFGAALPAEIKEMVLRDLETVGIDVVLRRASNRLNAIVANGADHLDIVMQIYNRDLPSGLPAAGPLDIEEMNAVEFGETPVHLRPVEIDEVPIEQRNDLLDGIAAMAKDGGKAGIYVDPRGHFHLLAQEHLDASEQDVEPAAAAI